MFKCLQKMNYPKQYIQFFKIIYQETYSQIQNNRYFSECIKLERGVRQGCPLSFLLYCTQNDVFTNSVNKDPNIKGFKLPGRKETLKLSQYADDTSFIYRLISQAYHLSSNNFPNIRKQQYVR